MTTKMDKNNWAIKIWNDGEYFDLWHVNHFLAGILLALAGILIGMDYWVNFSIALFLMLGWEIFEIIKKIEETRFNMTFDVILGLVGYFLIYYANLQMSEMNIMFFVVLIIWLIMEFWGYYAFKIRGGNQHWN